AVVTLDICLWKTIPSATNVPAQRNDPKPSSNTKFNTGTWKIPAKGVAAVLKPGTNLASNSDSRPCLEKASLVWRTHESGSSEIRHSSFSTFMPLRRPNSYQAKSATKDPTTASAILSGAFILPV